MYNRYRPMLVT